MMIIIIIIRRTHWSKACDIPSILALSFLVWLMSLLIRGYNDAYASYDSYHYKCYSTLRISLIIHMHLLLIIMIIIMLTLFRRAIAVGHVQRVPCNQTSEHPHTPATINSTVQTSTNQSSTFFRNCKHPKIHAPNFRSSKLLTLQTWPSKREKTCNMFLCVL